MACSDITVIFLALSFFLGGWWVGSFFSRIFCHPWFLCFWPTSRTIWSSHEMGFTSGSWGGIWGNGAPGGFCNIRYSCSGRHAFTSAIYGREWEYVARMELLKYVKPVMFTDGFFWNLDDVCKH